MEDLFDRSTTASDCCDANQGRFDDWAPTIDEPDAFEREVDNAKEALTSKLVSSEGIATWDRVSP